MKKQVSVHVSASLTRYAPKHTHTHLRVTFLHVKTCAKVRTCCDDASCACRCVVCFVMEVARTMLTWRLQAYSTVVAPFLSWTCREHNHGDPCVCRCVAIDSGRGFTCRHAARVPVGNTQLGTFEEKPEIQGKSSNASCVDTLWCIDMHCLLEMNRLWQYCRYTIVHHHVCRDGSAFLHTVSFSKD